MIISFRAQKADKGLVALVRFLRVAQGDEADIGQKDTAQAALKQLASEQAREKSKKMGYNRA